MDKLLSTNIKSLKRKSFIEPLAESNGIDPKMFKNKHTLKKAIVEKVFENQRDPITLESITDISHERMVTWTQDGKWYAADVESMYKYIKTSTINPWAIDKATGIMHAECQDEYLQRFDMENVKGLIEEINTRYRTIETRDDEQDKVPEHVIQRNDIENCGKGLYITHIIDFIEEQDDPKYVIAILHDTMFQVIHQFSCEVAVMGECSLHILAVLDELFVELKFMYMRFNGNKSSLALASTFFRKCHIALNDTVIERIFDVMDNIIREIRI